MSCQRKTQKMPPVSVELVENMKRRLDEAKKKGDEKKKRNDAQFQLFSTLAIQKELEVKKVEAELDACNQVLLVLSERESTLECERARKEEALREKVEHVDFLTQRFVAFGQNTTVEEVKNMALALAEKCKPRNLRMMRIKRVEQNDDVSEEEGKEVLLSIKAEIKNLEETAKGNPGWEDFGQQGEYFFAIPRESWADEELMRKVDFVFEGRTQSVVPVSRNGLSVPVGAELVFDEATGKAVKEILQFRTSERFTPPNNDIYYTFGKFVGDFPRGKEIFDDLAKALLEFCVPQGLRHTMTKKNVKKSPYVKKVAFGVKGFMDRMFRKKFEEEGHAFAENTKERTLQRIVGHVTLTFFRLGKAEKVSVVTTAALKKLKKRIPQSKYSFEGLKKLYRLAKITEVDAPLTEDVRRIVASARIKEGSANTVQTVDLESDKETEETEDEANDEGREDDGQREMERSTMEINEEAEADFQDELQRDV